MDAGSLLIYFQGLCAEEKAPEPLQQFEKALADNLSITRYEDMIKNLTHISNQEGRILD
jgi:hypothetical protein